MLVVIDDVICFILGFQKPFIKDLQTSSSNFFEYSKFFLCQVLIVILKLEIVLGRKFDNHLRVKFQTRCYKLFCKY